MTRQSPSRPVKKPSKSIRPSKPTKPAKKSKVTISTSKIFKRNHKAKSIPKSPASGFKNAISTARTQILTTNSNLLTQSHTTALYRLDEIKHDFATLDSTAVTQQKELLAPLDGETYTVVAATPLTNRCARKQEKTVTLGERMAAFKTMVSAKEAEFHALWQEWAQVQKDLVTAFATPENDLRETMTEAFNEAEVDIKTSVRDVIQLMRESEKELDLVRKKNLLAIISNM
ncbi:MAG: hypothetical protein M1840_002334 [Geoglossum simile]|nr:MAG: hypothetical protein M1840_002334 [Geoglossum simile]